MGGHSRENRQKYCCLQRTNRMQLLMSTDSPILPPCCESGCCWRPLRN